jgi:phosphoribosylanthranilate isomerase
VSRRALPNVGRGVAVKICGLTRPSDVVLAASLGAAAVGVVLAPSPRQVGLSRAAEVLSAAPPQVARVGVFVDPDPDLVAEVVATCGLHWVQLSGGESPERSSAIMTRARRVGRSRKGGVGLLRAVHVRSAGDLALDDDADAWLLDAPPRNGSMGGTGVAFDWSATLGSRLDRSRLVLAGGLTPENLPAAVRIVRPAMVDVSSGVEAAPGIKDPTRMAAFMAAARQLTAEAAPC